MTEDSPLPYNDGQNCDAEAFSGNVDFVLYIFLHFPLAQSTGDCVDTDCKGTDNKCNTGKTACICTVTGGCKDKKPVCDASGTCKAGKQ